MSYINNHCDDTHLSPLQFFSEIEPYRSEFSINSALIVIEPALAEMPIFCVLVVGRRSQKRRCSRDGLFA